MPTSYTAPIYDGDEISFEDFILRCSRAWAPTILLRDEPLDVLPTEDNIVEKSLYHAERFTDAEARLVELEAMSTADAAAAAKREHADAQRAYTVAQGDYYGLAKRYEVMREKVVAWEPPSEGYAFKDFVLQQIDESVDYDLHEPTVPGPSLTAAEWFKREIEKAERDRAYHRERAAQQAERNAERRLWIEALRDSLEAVPA